MGSQPLYNINIYADAGGVRITYPEFKYGIRTVYIDQSMLKTNNGSGDGNAIMTEDGCERLFSIIINNVRVFCKGGNWIPADSIYARVSNEKYECLIQEACNANFNMLRIWGGGLYERDIFYELCDKYGIMIWHDFMFACAEHPDDHEWFLNEVKSEIEYQTRRLRNHPSIVLWCGNNENQQFLWKWVHYGGERIYNYVAPEIVRKNCPQIPYWNSSAYGGINPNSESVGDRHHWRTCMMSPEMICRIRPEEYDRTNAKFITEYGYISPPGKSSVLRYLDGAAFDIQSDVWQHHNNTFEKDTVLAGIEYHYGDRIRNNSGGIDPDKYLFFAGLCQGLMYGYSLESFRARPECSGGLFWMYDDCWGETGWTIIDYYLRRKISYYFVKRALAPIKLILKGKSSLIEVTGINETPMKKTLKVEYGYISYDGSIKDAIIQDITMPAFYRGIILQFGQKDYIPLSGVFFARFIGDDTSTTFLKYLYKYQN